MPTSPVVLQELYAFAAKPTADAARLNPRHTFAQVWSLMFVATMACAVITAVTVLLVDAGGHKMSGFVNGLPAWKILLYAVLVGPLVEELAFRLPLKLERYSLAYGIAFLCIFVFTMFFQSNYELPNWLFDYVDWRGLLSYAFVSTTIAAVLLLSLKLANLGSLVKGALAKHYGLWFYTFLVLFGAIHIFNFEGLADFWFVAPLLVLPQLSLSFFIAFVRVRMGFNWAYLAHFLNNAVMIGLMLVLKGVSPVLVEVMSSLDVARLQHLPASELLAFGLINILFFAFLSLVCYFASGSLVAYLRGRSYAPARRARIAPWLSMLLPGLGQDYLGLEAAAKTHYRLLALVVVASVVPLAIPFTYASLDNALLMFAAPALAYCALTYYSMQTAKVTDADSSSLAQGLRLE